MAARQIGTHLDLRKLQRTLYQQAKKQPRWKAWSLYGELTRKAIVEEAMSRILRNRGSSGVDGYTVEAMEVDWEGFRDRLRKELEEKTYRPSPVKRIRIPKANGGERELGIPTVKDRVVRKRCRGEVIFMRYADDIIVGFEYQHEAERYLGELKERLAKFSLSLAEELHVGEVPGVVAGSMADPRATMRGAGGARGPTAGPCPVSIEVLK